MSNINLIINQKVIFFYLLILSHIVFSQSKLVDSETNKSLSDILIYNTKNEIIDITNENGIFKVKNDTIKIKNVLYGDTIIKNKKRIVLNKKIYILPTTVINDSLPIMVRLKNALINTENSLPKDTTIFYRFEIKTEIGQINWEEKVSGIYRVVIDNKNKVDVFICDNYKYYKDSIDFRIYEKIPFFKVKSVLCPDYQKKYREIYKRFAKKLKKELFKLDKELYNDTFKIKLYNNQVNVEYRFNNYIFSRIDSSTVSKLLYIQNGFNKSKLNFLMKNNKIYINDRKLYFEYNIKYDDKILNIKYSIKIVRIDNDYNCVNYFKFNDSLSNKLIFDKDKSP